MSLLSHWKYTKAESYFCLHWCYLLQVLLVLNIWGNGSLHEVKKDRISQKFQFWTRSSFVVWHTTPSILMLSTSSRLAGMKIAVCFKVMWDSWPGLTLAADFVFGIQHWGQGSSFEQFRYRYKNLICPFLVPVYYCVHSPKFNIIVLVKTFWLKILGKLHWISLTFCVVSKTF